MNAAQGTVGSDPVILATAGYDHTVRFWQAHSGICTRTVQHQDSVSFTAAPGRGLAGPGQAWGGGAAPSAPRTPLARCHAPRLGAPGLTSGVPAAASYRP